MLGFVEVGGEEAPGRGVPALEEGLGGDSPKQPSHSPTAPRCVQAAGEEVRCCSGLNLSRRLTGTSMVGIRVLDGLRGCMCQGKTRWEDCLARQEKITIGTGKGVAGRGGREKEGGRRVRNGGTQGKRKRIGCGGETRESIRA